MPSGFAASKLPRCRPPVHAAEDAARAALAWSEPQADPSTQRTCAVVGSADILRAALRPRGTEIDRHSLVIRLNNAPTVGWEAAVGRRTSLRVVNHVPLEKWIKLAKNKSALARTADGDEYHSLLCSAEAAPLGCVISQMHATSTIRATLATYQRLYASHRLTLASNPVTQWSLACNQELRGSSPSGGLLAVLLALAACDGPISLYGFWPFCCRGRTSTGGALDYKYHQGNRTRFVCCSRGRERMEAEFAFYELLAKRKFVNLVTDGADTSVGRSRGSTSSSNAGGGVGAAGGGGRTMSGSRSGGGRGHAPPWSRSADAKALET